MDNFKGFKSAKLVVIPIGIIKELEQNALTNSLLVTDIGYYEEAKNHFMERDYGCVRNIIIYCTSGQGWVEINRRKQTINKDQYIIITAGTPHKYGSNTDDPWSIYWIHFSGLKSHLLIGKPNEKVEVNLHSSSESNNRINLFEEIYTNMEMQYNLENLEYANICLWHFLGSFRYLSQFRISNEIDVDDKIERSIIFMKKNLAEKLSLKDVSETVNLSVSQFSLLFKNKTSRSPIDYLTHLRIREASKLLDHSNYKINKISLKVGYSDPFYFSRIFTQIMGMSPKKYRNIKKG